MNVLRSFLVCVFCTIVSAGLVHADSTDNFGIGISIGEYGARRLIIPYTAIQLYMRSFAGTGNILSDCGLIGKVLGSRSQAEWSSNDVPYYHDLYGVGIELIKPVLGPLYVSIAADLINYRISNPLEHTLKSGTSVIGSAGLGLAAQLGNIVYIYGGCYTSQGEAGIMGKDGHPDTLDETIDFTRSNNYRAGVVLLF